MTKKEMEILAEVLEEKAEAFGYHAAKFRATRKPSDALARADTSLSTALQIAKAMGIANSYQIKEAGVQKGKEVYIAQNKQSQ